MIQAIIVDDQLENIELLTLYLKKYIKNIEIIGSFTDPFIAIVEIKNLKPDVLFMDIDLGAGLKNNGIDLASKTSQYYKEVIFVTAYRKYWQEAFKLHAFEYILKPVKESQLAETIAGLLDREENGWSGKSPERVESLNKLKKNEIKSIDGLWLEKHRERWDFLMWKDIVLFEKSDIGKNIFEVTIHTTATKENQYFRCNTTIKSIEEMIKMQEQSIGNLIRKINEHQIINFEHVKSLNPTNGNIELKLDFIKPIHQPIKISEYYLPAIKKELRIPNRDL
jgi:DNA-binding LytR/AlgR family response regulator